MGLVMDKKDRLDELTTKHGQEILKNLQSFQTELSLQFEKCTHKFSLNGTISFISDHFMILLAQSSQSIRSRGPNIS